MSRIFITGSADGLGLAAARALAAEGHELVLHARSQERAETIIDIVPNRLGMVIGDLSSDEQTRSVADQVNAFGRMDAVIHNAGVYLRPERHQPPPPSQTLADAGLVIGDEVDVLGRGDVELRLHVRRRSHGEQLVTQAVERVQLGPGELIREASTHLIFPIVEGSLVGPVKPG